MGPLDHVEELIEPHADPNLERVRIRFLTITGGEAFWSRFGQKGVEFDSRWFLCRVPGYSTQATYSLGEIMPESPLPSIYHQRWHIPFWPDLFRDLDEIEEANRRYDQKRALMGEDDELMFSRWPSMRRRAS